MDVRQVGSSGRTYTDALVAGQAWVESTLTFSFPTATVQFTGYPRDHPFAGFESFNTVQQEAVRTILSSISTFAKLTFTELSVGQGSNAILRFGMTDDIDDGVAAFAYLPSASPMGGDSWYRNEGGRYDNPALGNGAWRVIAHEIGHALGLAHPQDKDGGKPLMPEDHDLVAWTVMSYKGYPNDPWWWPQSYMVEDIAALQFLYGANFAYNSTDSVYQWSPITGELSINGVGQGAPGRNLVFETVWDGGGQDTYDFANYVGTPHETAGTGMTYGMTIDLRPGGWTRLMAAQNPTISGYVPGNIANALQYDDDPRSLIENAIGTSGDDTIHGNEAANRLEGRDAADVLYGHGGVDILLGGLGSDELWGGDEDDYLIGGGGSDQMDGGAGNDLLEGGDLYDYLSGGAGDDVLRAGSGDDWLNGGTGHNLLFAGEGLDIAVFSYEFVEAEFLVATDGTVTVLGPSGSRDELFGIEVLQFPGQSLTLGEVSDIPGPDFILIASTGWKGGIGGSGTIFGTAGVQDITFLNGAGAIDLDASFNRGGDVLHFSGNAAEYGATIAGSRLTLSAGLEFSAISIPIGSAKTELHFADGLRNLVHDEAAGTVKIGSQVMPAATITAPPESGFGSPIDLRASATIVLLPEAQVAIAGQFEVMGSVMPDRISVAGAGRYVFDASFNRGLDTIELEHARAQYSAQLQGSRVILSGAGEELSIPVGTTSTMLDFDGDQFAMFYEAASATVWLGTDRLDPSVNQLRVTANDSVLP
jgi:serralysin